MARVSFTLRRPDTAPDKGSYIRYDDDVAYESYGAGGASVSVAVDSRVDYDSALRADGLQLAPTDQFDELFFDATSVCYGEVNLQWAINIATTLTASPQIMGIVLVYSPYGEPQTISSGTILVESSTTFNFDHTGLPEGRWAYYSLFVNYRSNSGDNYFERVASISEIVPKNYASNLMLWNRIPEYYRIQDTLAGSLDYSTCVANVVPGEPIGPLFKFLSIFGFDLDRIRTLLDYTMVAQDPSLANTETLDAIANQLGIDLLSSDLGAARLRTLLSDVGFFRRSKGTLSGTEFFGRAVSGSDVEFDTTTGEVTVYSQRVNYIKTPVNPSSITDYRAADVGEVTVPIHFGDRRPEIVEVQTTNMSASRTPSMTFSQDQAGDVILFFVTSGDTATVTVPSPWVNLLGGNTDVESAAHEMVGIYQVTASAAHTYTATNLYDVAETGSAVGLCIRGVNATTPINAVQTGTGLSATWTIPSITPTEDNCLVIAGIGVDAMAGYTYGATDWSLITGTVTATGSTTVHSYIHPVMANVAISGGSVASSFSDDYIVYSVALNPLTAATEGITYSGSQVSSSGADYTLLRVASVIPVQPDDVAYVSIGSGILASQVKWMRLVDTTTGRVVGSQDTPIQTPTVPVWGIPVAHTTTPTVVAWDDGSLSGTSATVNLAAAPLEGDVLMTFISANDGTTTSNAVTGWTNHVPLFAPGDSSVSMGLWYHVVTAAEAQASTTIWTLSNLFSIGKSGAVMTAVVRGADGTDPIAVYAIDNSAATVNSHRIPSLVTEQNNSLVIGSVMQDGAITYDAGIVGGWRLRAQQQAFSTGALFSYDGPTYANGTVPEGTVFVTSGIADEFVSTTVAINPVPAASPATWTNTYLEMLIDVSTTSFDFSNVLAERNHVGEYFDGNTIRGGWLIDSQSVSDYRWAGAANNSYSIFTEEYERTKGVIQDLLFDVVPVTEESKYTIVSYNAVPGV